MTKDELSLIYSLAAQRNSLNKTLERLRSYAESCTPSVSGLPHAKTIADRTSTAALIVYCEEELERIAKALDAEQPGLDEYINAAPDAVTRLVMAMRYKSGYDWPRIAHLLGGENTPDSVRMIHNRFLDRDTRLKD